MIKKLLFVIIVSIVTFITVGSVNADPPMHCDGANNVIVETNQFPQNVYNEVQSALNNYVNYLQPNGRYELCFEFVRNGLPGDYYYEVDDNQYILKLGVSTLAGDVVIEGLKLKQIANLNSALITVKTDPSHKVIFHNLVGAIETIPLDSMTAIAIYGSSVEINSPSIDGGGDGECVKFFKVDGASVVGGNVSNCKVGMLIQDSSNIRIGAVDENAFTTEAVSITGNEVGVKVESPGVMSNYNMWAFSSFSGNTSAAIEIVAGNENLPAPELVKVDGKTLTCEDDGAGKMIRKLKFKPMGQEGLVTFFHFDDVHAPVQGPHYVNRCALDLDGNCTLGPFLSPVVIPDEKCGLDDVYLVAIFTGENLSSTDFSDHIDMGDIVVFGGGVISQPTSDPEGASVGGDAVGDSGVVEESGAQFIDEGTVTIADAPIGGAIPLSAAGCGSSLIPYDMHNTFAPSLGLWWIIFAIGFIASLRFHKAPIPRRRKKR